MEHGVGNEGSTACFFLFLALPSSTGSPIVKTLSPSRPSLNKSELTTEEPFGHLIPIASPGTKEIATIEYINA